MFYEFISNSFYDILHEKYKKIFPTTSLQCFLLKSHLHIKLVKFLIAFSKVIEIFSGKSIMNAYIHRFHGFHATGFYLYMVFKEKIGGLFLFFVL